MKKINFLILTFIISTFVFSGDVFADFNVNANLGPGMSSTGCSTGVCANTVPGYYGIKVTLMRNNGGTLVDAGGSSMIVKQDSDYDLSAPPSCDRGNLNYCWVDYFNWLESIKTTPEGGNELNKILRRLGTSVSSASGLYLRVEPVVGIKYHNVNDYYFSGSALEVVYGWWNYNGYNPATNGSYTVQRLAQAFMLNTPNNSDLLSGNWNVLRNYYTDFKLNTPQSPYINNYSGLSFSSINNMSALNFHNTFDTSIYGKILIDISNYSESGSLIIRKISSTSNRPIFNTASFAIHRGSNCTGEVVRRVSTSAGTATVSGLDIGEYSIEETAAPSGYTAPANRCVVGSIYVDSAVSQTVDIPNEPSCSVGLAEANSLTGLERENALIELYNLMRRRGSDFTGLLNFSAPACNVYTVTLDNSSCFSSRASRSQTFLGLGWDGLDYMS